LKRNLRLNHQNTLYIMLQALACLSLVEKYECFGEIFECIVRTPCTLCSKHSRVSVWYSGTNVEEESAPESSKHPVYYAPSTRVSQSGRVVRMLKRNLRLNHQNTLYIMLQTLACLSLVQKYECFGEIFDLLRRNAPYIVPRTLACFRLARKNILSTYALEQQYSFLYGSILSLCITAWRCRETDAKSERPSISLKIDYSHSEAICTCVSQAGSDGQTSGYTDSQTFALSWSEHLLCIQEVPCSNLIPQIRNRDLIMVTRSPFTQTQ